MRISEHDDDMFKRISKKYSYYHCIELDNENIMKDHYEKECMIQQYLKTVL